MKRGREIVAASYVRSFMREERAKLRRRQRVVDALGKEQHGPEYSKHPGLDTRQRHAHGDRRIDGHGCRVIHHDSRGVPPPQPSKRQRRRTERPDEQQCGSQPGHRCRRVQDDLPRRLRRGRRGGRGKRLNRIKVGRNAPLRRGPADMTAQRREQRERHEKLEGCSEPDAVPDVRAGLPAQPRENCGKPDAQRGLPEMIDEQRAHFGFSARPALRSISSASFTSSSVRLPESMRCDSTGSERPPNTASNSSMRRR